ncbi:MAG: DUF2442 domain-containing protein [Chloroflexi bacterium]|nr:DUF2442 domain-containing protein [Chloroflexota bacterium]MCI0575384.1 DUF2442 domain-containing protein [Chloroflexota bacterium]MCI0643845.1 DUF2442 domain-containing protein [Chloroflexota bacterium]MCI0726707.1 DUF2442 domain-containing protein [Chloroflexota bacterium]
MSIVTKAKRQPPPAGREEPRFERLEVTDELITAHFSDGRIVSVPLWWSWRLEQATPLQRANYEIIGSGRTAYWPDLDEHLSVQGFFTGTPAPRPQSG